MANGLTLNATLAYAGNNVTIAESIVNLAVVVTGNGQNARKGYNAPVADTALPLGSVAVAGGYLFVKNNDPTNFVTIRTGVAGTKITKLLAGDFCLFRMDPTITAPSTSSDTAICSIDYAVFDL